MIDIDAHGLDAIAEGLRTMQERAYLIGPVGYRVRDRIIESERRHLNHALFMPRAKSTLKRYRYPIESMADEEEHRSPGSGPLDRLGLLERVLTTRQHPGQRDSIKQAHGGLDVAFGVKARGPAAYIGMQAAGSGGRARRDPFKFDALAHDDAAGDVLEYIVERFGAGS